MALIGALTPINYLSYHVYNTAGLVTDGWHLNWPEAHNRVTFKSQQKPLRNDQLYEDYRRLFQTN